jgi:hypothetical protein
VKMGNTNTEITINLSALTYRAGQERFSFKTGCIPSFSMKLGHLRLRALVVLLDHLHLVFYAQFEFLETHFFQFFIV